ncbi:bifunctional transcriptional activator/DNA repair enzyme AdaA [Neobacillus jeddahensis]|uniref:bifunctional transcriptional activator/DNA repair enzyme AdaA n=1 Tax=Neobacillus jeddahensis TaxID=1461580 RepID=UPI000590AA19|nr:Ada metal-binding domain-containing protein [Neobacillus jeddahensis]
MIFLNEEIMWDAVVHCKKEYDGTFFYAVRSTGICCKPSFKSKIPLKDNITFYSSVSKAIADGYRPCKRCRPNILQTNEEEIVQSVKQFIENEYHQTLTLEQMSLYSGVSKYHLQRVFKKNLEMSPLKYVLKLRMDEAKVLLQMTGQTVTEIAHGLGYTSSVHFSSVFRQQTGYTPSEYRIRR